MISASVSLRYSDARLFVGFTSLIFSLWIFNRYEIGGAILFWLGVGFLVWGYFKIKKKRSEQSVRANQEVPGLGISREVLDQGFQEVSTPRVRNSGKRRLLSEMKTVRWVLFLPLALISGFVFYILVSLAWYLLWPTKEESTPILIQHLVTSALFGVVVVFVGTSIAPARKLMVSIILAILVVLLVALPTFSLIPLPFRLEITSALSSVIGALLVVYHFFKKGKRI